MSIETEASRVSWSVRPMRHEDIEECLKIWTRVGLTEGRQTVSSSLSADPGGFNVAELAGTGEIVGMCAFCLTRQDIAFVGFYAVKPEYQGIGIGRELWAKTQKRFDDSFNIGLYGVPTMTDKYKKSGFILEDSTRMVIYESKLSGNVEDDKLFNLRGLKDIQDLSDFCHLQIIDGKTSESLFKKLVDYDHSIHKYSRENLLELYLRGDDVPLCFAVVRMTTKHQPTCGQTERKLSCCAKPSQDVIIEGETPSTIGKSCSSLSSSTCATGNLWSTNEEQDLSEERAEDVTKSHQSATNSPSPKTITTSSPSRSPSFPVAAKCSKNTGSYEILGYGIIRDDNNQGGMVGPIYADSSDICEVLLKNLIDRFELKPKHILSIMALSSNKQACKLLDRVGLQEVEQCSRMFTKFIPATSFSKIYYVHSPNFTLF